jgi:L-asparaginase II
MLNPIIAEVTRGGIVESRHTGSFAVVDFKGKVIAFAGDIELPVFPRSAIKAFQCLPLIESGGADEYGFTPEEIALCCASHNGEPDHVRVASSMLKKAGIEEAAYECGSHWPSEKKTLHAMIRAGEEPRDIHNNCSGKHSGMLALAQKLSAPLAGYTLIDHPVQRTIAKTLSEICDVDADTLPCGIDGCSVPTWAIPLRNMALGFARLVSGEGLSAKRKDAARRIIEAAREHPFMVAGTGRFCTKLMQAVPRAFVKTGAEGVFCGGVPHAGLGIALKCDDGASRASEATMASILASLDVWTEEEKAALATFAHSDLKNWRKIEVGEIHAVSARKSHDRP